ncbi:hypothetical protein IFM89_023267 [Coptis chinensis]|uniref:Uncharacterized protein n=1 Tax=Coptis chinensis TaxID=261450 RepID=A0A835LZB7_9MAGN|nr:hypothetical protein IFM89_023267 [Coptis chinensis]
MAMTVMFLCSPAFILVFCFLGGFDTPEEFGLSAPFPEVTPQPYPPPPRARLMIKRRETREYVESEEQVELEGVSTRQKKVPPEGKSTSNKGVGVTHTRKRRATEEGSSKSVKEGNHTEVPLKKKTCLVTCGREPAINGDFVVSVGQNDIGFVEPGTSSDEGDDTLLKKRW